MRITQDKLIGMLKSERPGFKEAVIGRALVAIFKRQTKDEQAVNVTNCHNGIGFTGADAHSGCITAKYYIKHRTLLDWQVERWTKTNRNGVPRIAKYWKQLDQIARERQAWEDRKVELRMKEAVAKRELEEEQRRMEQKFEMERV